MANDTELRERTLSTLWNPEGIRFRNIEDTVREFLPIAEAINEGWEIPPKVINKLVHHIKFDLDAEWAFCPRSRATLHKMAEFLREHGYLQ